MNLHYRKILKEDIPFINEIRNLYAEEYLHDSKKFTLKEICLLSNWKNENSICEICKSENVVLIDIYFTNDMQNFNNINYCLKCSKEMKEYMIEQLKDGIGYIE